MPTLSDIVKTLHSLGRKIHEAIEADNWERVRLLVEQRSSVARQLPTGDDEVAWRRHPDVDDETLAVLAEQNERLTTLLKQQRSEIEDELAQIDEMRHAQNSYAANSTQNGVLPPELSG